MENIVQSIWSKSKLLIKSLIIGLLVLLLQIPAFYVKDLIGEREQRQKEAIAEVSSKWAGRQIVSGPVLVLPYWKAESDTNIKKTQRKDFAYFLPDDLVVDANVVPHEKHRGIYKVMLYSSTINFKGSFETVPIERLNILPQDIIWEEASIKFPISDNKGLNEEFKIKWQDTVLILSPQTSGDPSISNALQANLKLSGADDLKNAIFSASISLNGSQQLLITPTGRSTTVNMSSSWPHPSFTGDVLPQNSEIKKNGFSATWKSVSHKRNFPQQWTGNAYSIAPYFFNGNERDFITVDHDQRNTEIRNNINSSSFGTNLFVPVNGYQKTMRTVKYAALCILLTFASFFLIETTNKKSVHPFQYVLIGLALVLFYTLLLSFSEYIGFNFAYAVSSVFTIGLIAWFVKGILGSSRLTTILSVVLLLMYTYVFTILQLQDYSLLLGSIGLFITLAVIMHFSKKIQW